MYVSIVYWNVPHDYNAPHQVFFMEQRLTCANHSGEEIVLDQIGWNNFNCPKCGSDYSVGRKVVLLDPKHVQNTRKKVTN